MEINPAEVTVFILAGGRGTRLQSIWEGPKALIPVEGRPFLDYLLDDLAAAGFERLVLLTGRKGEDLEAAFQGRELVSLRETSPLGTGGALRAASPLAVEWNLILNGDSYGPISWDHFLRAGAGSSLPFLLVATEMPDAGDYGTLRIDAGGRVTEFVEKSGGGPGLVNAGIYLAHRDFFREDLSEEAGEDPLSLERTVLPGMAAGGRLGAWMTGEKFWDVGTPERLEAFRRWIQRGRG
ncbi:MAG: NTP transferase domain-containing protein [Candidatus Eisenbacteria bacterium]|uniref:NTP transferase domain-containing protein n=1 Tax=Eiseniibacteriota bacterium TaxID=2212470 RepID=A0A948RS39_UNCEI|nr:NTP transferase domain-containing protein [Candidatus Eisenbacteria bacterium]MBU1948817.1 NTP transferase domain-containing protein [Candidatus Eisenbacteria bacterium]MBU2689988.1 NTP transferase domain-containing protein [Candidatus Eisenbacteria bacterium]